MWVWKLSQRLARAARPDTPPLISDTEEQNPSENGKWLSFSIFYQIFWCTGHQIQSEKNSVKVKIFSNLCCPNLWGGSPVLLQFSPWNHLVDLKEKKLIMRLLIINYFRAVKVIAIINVPFWCSAFFSNSYVLFNFLFTNYLLCAIQILVSSPEMKNVPDYYDYCDFVWVGAVGYIANPSPAPASYPII